MSIKCYRCGDWDGSKCACPDGQTIIHGDCREVLPALEPGSVRLIWTDPPYGHDNQGDDLQGARVRDNVKGARKRSAVTIANDSGRKWELLMQEFFWLASGVLAPDCCCCCCCCGGGGGPKPTFAKVANWMDRELSFFHAVVWDKSDRGNGMGWRFRRNYEFVMVAHRRGGKLAWADDGMAIPNILRIAPEPNLLHPTTKPTGLIKRFVELTTKEADIVLDPFLGSGSTLVAAKAANRRGIGIEIEERYCETASERLRQGVLDFDGDAA